MALTRVVFYDCLTCTMLHLCYDICYVVIISYAILWCDYAMIWNYVVITILYDAWTYERAVVEILLLFALENRVQRHDCISRPK